MNKISTSKNKSSQKSYCKSHKDVIGVAEVSIVIDHADLRTVNAINVLLWVILQANATLDSRRHIK